MPETSLRASTLIAAVTFGLVVGGYTLSASAQSSQAPSWYGGGTGAASFLSDSGQSIYDSGWGLSGLAGYDFGNGFRAEGELGWLTNDIKNGTGDTDLFYGMASGYYDFSTGSPMVPYIGGGLGYGSISMDTQPNGFPAVDDSDGVGLWHISAGLGYQLSPRTTLFGGYRYLSTLDQPRFNNAAGQTFDNDYDNHILLAGMRFGF